jgi:hypothetical protein
MDLSDLAPLYDLSPPVVTAYLDLAPNAPDAATRLDITWKDLVRDLTDQSVPEPTIDAIAAARETEAAGGPTRVLVAADGRVRLDQILPDPPITPAVAVGPLPHLLRFINWRATRRSHVVVLADRVGADIVAYPATGGPVAEISADTAEWPVHKTGTGGWAARRYETSVEESWERSAKRVAELVERAAHEVNPQVLIGSGDQRAISLLTEQLPDRLRAHLVVVPGGGRHDDGGATEIDRRVAEAVAEQVARDESDVLGKFAEARGRREGAADGVARVVEALQRGQVETLILTQDLDDDQRELPYGPQPTEVATDPAQLSAMGVETAMTAPMVDVLLKAALGSAADVLVVSETDDRAPEGGVGALLRFDLAASR